MSESKKPIDPKAARRAQIFAARVLMFCAWRIKRNRIVGQRKIEAARNRRKAAIRWAKAAADISDSVRRAGLIPEVKPHEGADRL